MVYGVIDKSCDMTVDRLVPTCYASRHFMVGFLTIYAANKSALDVVAVLNVETGAIAIKGTARADFYTWGSGS